MHALISPVGHESRPRVSDEERGHLETVLVNERTPLIRNNNYTERVNASYTPYIVSIMVLMLVTGIIIGTYLLIEQDKQWPVNIPFELIMRDKWDTQQYDKPLLGHGVTKQAKHLILTQTDTTECYEILECKVLLREMQVTNKNNTGGFVEVPYNFLIASNGITYEGRGWDRIGAVDPDWDDSSISLAFIGNFERKWPTTIQVQEATAFIDEAISRKKLSPSYTIIGKIKAKSPKYLFREFERWKQWDKSNEM